MDKSKIAMFGWWHRSQRGQEDHVIALCAGHFYLTDKGRWKSGSGDMAGLPPADQCCVCMGTATIPRMKDAPLAIAPTSL